MDSRHQYMSFRHNFDRINELETNSTHPDEGESEGVEACPWMGKHLLPLILTWDEEQEKAVSAPDSCLSDGSNLSLALILWCRNVVLQSDSSIGPIVSNYK